MDDLFTLSQAKQEKIDTFITRSRRDVPNFYEEGQCTIKYIPVENGKLRVFHHKPEKIKTIRPIVFFPGFGNTPWTWRHSTNALHNRAEYYYIETREKKSSKMNRKRDTKFSIDRIAKDIGEVIKKLSLAEKDYVLMSASFGGGIVLHGLWKEYFHPGTTLVLDPFPKWTQQRLLSKIFFSCTPPFLLSVLKYFLGHIVLSSMKNKIQRKRNMETVKGAEPWKWRKAVLQNVDFDMYPHLEEIKQDVILIHGPPDRYHPREIYVNIAKKIPNCRFIFMDTKESNREQLASAIMFEFAKQSGDANIPTFLQQFEITEKI
ncbi:MAG: alpha/beta hydrolase [Asgard group archaeon]|nr:alpha/beta hydrolase [Asgard group archaeon]